VLFAIKTSFIVSSIVLVLVYIFLSLYLKTIYRNLNAHIDENRNRVRRIEEKVDILMRRR